MCNSGFLQQTAFSSKTRENMETSNRFECIKHASIGPNIQDGHSRGHQKLHLQGGMGSLGRPHGPVLSHSHSSKVKSLLRFHVGGHYFQFRVLPFGTVTAPLEFTCIAREVKLILQSRGIRIHQYLDHWLLQAPTQQICLEQSKQLVVFVQELGWVIDFKKCKNFIVI